MRFLAFSLLLALPFTDFAQYDLTIESFPAVQEGLTTYRFYVNMEDPTDRMSAVFGNNDLGLFINTPEGAYNSPFNSSWNASGINPAFLTTFPELADDTYATIGLTGPASTSGVADAADPSVAEDAAQPITPYFLTPGATALESTTLTGSSWYILNTAGNGLPNDDMQVLILQVTTAGGVSGTLNYQVFPFGLGENNTLVSSSFNVEPQEEVPGCTDPTSCTYNPEATLDDGSCEYLDAIGVCGGDCTEASPDSPTVCAGDEVYGCINLDACNYDPNANISDGSCVGTPDGFCDCEGMVPDTDNDGVCDEDEVFGCTDGLACNYDAAATEEDGSCEYCSCAEDAFTLSVESYPAQQEGLTTYRVYVNTISSTDRLSAVFSNADNPLTINVPEGAWNSPEATTWNASGVNPALFVDYPNIVDDSYATIGLDGPAGPLGPTYADPTLVDPEMVLTDLFTTDGAMGFTSDTDPGLSWFVLNTAENGLPNDDGQILVMQITTAGSISGTLNYQVFPQGNQASDITMTTSFDGVGTFGANVCGCTLGFACNFDENALIDDGSCEFICPGCTDASACNYDSSAIQDDGSCLYHEDEGYCDCEGNQLDALGICGGDCTQDSDSDGICDDIDACVGEYDECGVCQGPGAIYECGCFGASEVFCDCEGNVLDVCGVCGGDGSSCIGCTYEFACNYDSSATVLDIAQCEFGTCPGCTIFGACNYNPTVTIDDGSCEWCSCIDDQDPSSGSATLPENNLNSEDPNYWLELETVVTHTEGDLDGMTTYRLYLNMVHPTDFLSSCSGDINNPFILNSSSGSWYNDAASTTWNAQGVNPAFFGFFPNLAYDSFLTLGAEDGTVPTAQQPTSVSGEFDFTGEFVGGPGSNFTVDGPIGGAWYLTFPGVEAADTHVSFAGDDLRVMVAQITTAGVLSGQVQVQVFIESDQANEFREVLPFCNPDECGGCTDASALNYAAEALYDDGSCVFPILGCTDSSAFNFCPAFTIDDGSCLYDYLGCMDAAACNFVIEATYDDGNQCQYIQEGECDCEGNVLDECGECGGLGIPEGECDCEGNILDECGVCGGQGIPEGECDCEGNVLDECGVCGGEGIPLDECDCEGNILDECGVCGGEGIADGACDCQGSVLDALGVCGGDCLTDQNSNGICDLEELESGACGPEACGPGTVWDEDTQACMVAYPSDSNFDGCVQLNDLLDLLSAYGLCQDVEATFSCGEPLSYQGYDYETVQIGEQCWFAENLRSENYENGESITTGLSDNEWYTTTSGAVAVYGEGSSTCFDNSPDGDACDESWSLNEYGRLYNWYAVNDARGLCPSGWHVATDDEWTVMTDFLGFSPALKMKVNYAWLDGTGTNSSGFSALPGGRRESGGDFQQAGSFAGWWTSSSDGSNIFTREIGHSTSNIQNVSSNGSNVPTPGRSVRCIQD